MRKRARYFDRFFAELLTALGINPNGSLPAWWQGWPAKPMCAAGSTTLA
ncbi:hypothetical protein RNZ50_10100 [Paracoccaceae bacterium Fryx2]|nr:hypothetical protein [Paracoccaceae bacterium Fryx2]